MSRDEALRRLRANETDLRGRHVEALYLFGSTARDEARPDSDIDLLIRFAQDAKIDLFDLAELRLDMTDLLSTEVDVAVSHDGNEAFVARLQRDLVRVF